MFHSRDECITVLITSNFRAICYLAQKWTWLCFFAGIRLAFEKSDAKILSQWKKEKKESSGTKEALARARKKHTPTDFLWLSLTWKPLAKFFLQAHEENRKKMRSECTLSARWLCTHTGQQISLWVASPSLFLLIHSFFVWTSNFEAEPVNILIIVNNLSLKSFENVLKLSFIVFQ